jgi:hypothetical protein
MEICPECGNDEVAEDLPVCMECADSLCPECLAGEVLVGPHEADTGHQYYSCSLCSWSA